LSGRPGTIRLPTVRALPSEPRAVRIANYQPPSWHLDLEVAPFGVLAVVDLRRRRLPSGLTDQAHTAIRARVSEVASRQIVPMVIGGDHSMTYPSAMGVADTYGRGKVGMVHFDAHADTGQASWGNLASHATPMRRLIESGAIPGRNFVQLGLRGYWPEKETLDWMRGQQMRWHLLGAVRNIALRTNLVAMDVVEVSPPYDHAEITAQSANRCILDAISTLAVKKSRGGNA
jgi:arginase family enzyme